MCLPPAPFVQRMMFRREAVAAAQKFQANVVRTADAIDLASRTLNTEVDVPNKAGQLLPQFFKTSLVLRICDSAFSRQYFPRLGNRRLIRNHPGVQRPADAAQRAESFESAHAAA